METDDPERAPVPPCPACGSRDVLIEPVRVVQLTLLGPPEKQIDVFFCRGCGGQSDDYDDWPGDELPWTGCDTLPRA